MIDSSASGSTFLFNFARVPAEPVGSTTRVSAALGVGTMGRARLFFKFLATTLFITSTRAGGAADSSVARRFKFLAATLFINSTRAGGAADSSVARRFNFFVTTLTGGVIVVVDAGEALAICAVAEEASVPEASGSFPSSSS